MDRDKAGQVGLTQRDVANSLLISLSSAAAQIAPTQWLDWRTGVSYCVARADAAVPHEFARRAAAHADQRAFHQRQQHDADLHRRRGQPRPMPEWAPDPARPPRLTAIPARGSSGTAVALQPGDRRPQRRRRKSSTTTTCSRCSTSTPTWTAAIWAAWARASRRSCAEMTPKLPRGTTIDVRGQVRTMQNSFYRLGLGMIFAVVLVYLLMAVNFQSLAGSVHHPDGAARRAGRHRLDAVHHPDHVQRALADGLHHVHRRGHRQQHSAGGLRQRSARGRHGRALRRAVRRPHAHPPGAS